MLINAQVAREWPPEALAVLINVTVTARRLERAIPARERRSADAVARCYRRLHLEALDAAAKLTDAEWMPDWLEKWFRLRVVPGHWQHLRGSVRQMRAFGVPRPLRRAVVVVREVWHRLTR